MWLNWAKQKRRGCDLVSKTNSDQNNTCTNVSRKNHTASGAEEVSCQTEQYPTVSPHCQSSNMQRRGREEAVLHVPLYWTLKCLIEDKPQDRFKSLYLKMYLFACRKMGLNMSHIHKLPTLLITADCKGSGIMCALPSAAR